MGKYGHTGRTHNDFVCDMKEHRPEMAVVSRYRGYQDSINLKCRMCSTVFETTPRLALSPTKGTCPECTMRSRKKQLMLHGMHRIDARIRAKFGGRIRRVGPYIGASALSTRFVCDAGHTFENGPKFVLNTNNGCPHCAAKIGGLKTRKPLSDLMSALNGRSIAYVSGYKMGTSKCRFRCLACNHTWTTLPNSIVKGSGCPRCAYADTDHYGMRSYMLGERRVRVQGYEDYALDWITTKVSPKLIAVASDKTVPMIDYVGVDGKHHNHYPDVFIASKNMIIEVKSPWTLGITEKGRRARMAMFRTNQLKSLAAKRRGYRYIVVLMDGANKIQLPPNWDLLSWRELRAAIHQMAQDRRRKHRLAA